MYIDNKLENTGDGCLLYELKRMPPKLIVKLGCKNGSSFFYCGEVENLIQTIYDLDDMFLHKACDSIYNYVHNRIRVNQGAHPKRHEEMSRTIKNLVEYLSGYEAIWRRKILERYQSTIEEKTLIILIEGTERGDYWDTYEAKGRRKKLDLTDIPDDCIKNLLIEVYKRAADDLESTYTGTTHSSEAISTRKSLEKFFRDDPYNMLSMTGGDAIIEHCRRMASTKTHQWLRGIGNGK